MKSNKKLERAQKKRLVFMILIFSLVIAVAFMFFYRNLVNSIFVFIGSNFLIHFYFYFSKYFKASARVKKLEEVFPDFLQLMSSNLKAGMTIDRALLMSSRPEFSPLDEEILITGKDITAGKNIETAFLDMSKRIGSEKVHKIILLIISGIKSGGDLAVLLEETSYSMRQRQLLEKKAASNIAMYFIFIFIAVTFAAPALFSLSTVLVELMTEIFADIPQIETSSYTAFTISSINVSTTFIIYFSVFFILVIDVLASLILGLIGKGDEKQGLKYLPFIAVISIAIYFLGRAFISNFMSGIM